MMGNSCLLWFFYRCFKSPKIPQCSVTRSVGGSQRRGREFQKKPRARQPFRFLVATTTKVPFLTYATLFSAMHFGEFGGKTSIKMPLLGISERYNDNKFLGIYMRSDHRFFRNHDFYWNLWTTYKMNGGFTLSFHAHCAQMQRVNQNLVVLLTGTISELASNFFFSWNLLFRRARAVEQFRGCVVIFILFAVYTLQTTIGYMSCIRNHFAYNGCGPDRGLKAFVA